MTGRLTKIEDTVNSQLDSLHVKIVPRGIPYFVDSLLRGTVRFAKRTGNTNAILNPDNTYKIGSTVAVGDNSISTSVSQWVDVDSIVSMGPNKEAVEVDDIIGNQIVFKTRLKFGYGPSSEFILHASPMKPNGNLQAGSTSIQVMSKYKLTNGDVLTYKGTPGLLQSLIEIKCDRAIYGGVTTDPTFKYLYLLELKEPITRGIDSDEIIYIRSYPAYFSNPIRVPNLFNSSLPMGPFLLDYLSGRIVEGFTPIETFSIRLKDRSQTYRMGDEYSYVTAAKNHEVLGRSLDARLFGLFNTIRGDTRITPNKVALEVGDNRQYRSSYRLTPDLDFEGQEYRFTTESNSSGTLIIYLEPGYKVELNIRSGVQAHIIAMPSGKKYRMDIVFVSESAKARVLMSSWTQVGPQIQYIEYSYHIEAVGRGKYQSTGLILKPYFITPEILSGRYDSGDSYDNGFVYF